MPFLVLRGDAVGDNGTDGVDDVFAGQVVILYTLLSYFTALKHRPGAPGCEHMFVLFVKKKLADIANFSKRRKQNENEFLGWGLGCPPYPLD